MCVTVHELMTARKRSLGQGNIFTPVCHSVHRGCLVWGVPGPREGLVPGGYLVKGGVFGDPLGWLLLWAVLILLECILVVQNKIA